MRPQLTPSRSANALGSSTRYTAASTTASTAAGASIPSRGGAATTAKTASTGLSTAAITTGRDIADAPAIPVKVFSQHSAIARAPTPTASNCAKVAQEAVRSGESLSRSPSHPSRIIVG